MGDIEAVGARSADNLLVFAIVTIPSNPTEMTAQSPGPVIINPDKKAWQTGYFLSDKYSVRHRILDEMKKAAEG